MAQGSKASYTSKQKRQAKHIYDGYIADGLSKAERRAWATVNKESGGGKKSGPERKKTATKTTKKTPSKTAKKTPSKKTPSKTSSNKRSEAAKKGWATRRKNAKKT